MSYVMIFMDSILVYRKMSYVRIYLCSLIVRKMKVSYVRVCLCNFLVYYAFFLGVVGSQLG